MPVDRIWLMIGALPVVIANVIVAAAALYSLFRAEPRTGPRRRRT